MAVIDVIKFQGIENRNWLVYRFPRDNYVFGTQLIVGEGQIAVFVKGGKALDYFSAGTYTLSTQNIPILQAIINLPFGRRTPFTAELFFINKTAKLDILWGTTDPIVLIDPKYNIKLRVRSFGQFGIRINDYRVFLTELIGAIGFEQVVKYDLVVNYYKGVLTSKIKSLIADIVINQKISVLEISPRLDEISSICKEKIAFEFDRFGIEVVNFYLSSINFPDEDFVMINKILGEKAAFDIIGDNRYNVKRTFDVMETAAGNESGGVAAAGIGLGIGAGAGFAVGGKMAGVAGSVFASPSSSVQCMQCKALNNPDTKFCANCGSKLTQKEDKRECPECKTLVDINVKYCPNCGVSMSKTKRCPKCNSEIPSTSKFCTECGEKLEDRAL